MIRAQAARDTRYKKRHVRMCETLWAVLITVLKTSFIVAVLFGVLSGASPQRMAWVVYETLEFSARFVRLMNGSLDAGARRFSMVTNLRLMRSNRFVTFPFPSEVELSCWATCGRVSFVRFAHVDGTYIAGQNNCAIRTVSEPLNTGSSIATLTPHDSGGNGTRRVSRFRGVGSIDDVLDVVVDVKRTISGRRKGTTARASERAARDEALVDVIGVRQLGGPCLSDG